MDPNVPTTREALEKLSLKELKSRAEHLGIDNPQGHKSHRETWIKAILDAQAPVPPVRMDPNVPTTREALEKLSLKELKSRAEHLGIDNPQGHKSHRETWIKAILDAQASVPPVRMDPNPTTREALEELSLKELKSRAEHLGIDDPQGHKSHKETWIKAILDAQAPVPPAGRPPAPPSESSQTPVGTALLIGASQCPNEFKGISGPEDLKGIELRKRYLPRAASGSQALPDVAQDVATMRKIFTDTSTLPGMEVHGAFVGKDGTGALTRRAFLNKVQRLLEAPGKRLFVLYFAGHGTNAKAHPGALAVEDGVVTLGDLIGIWESRPIGQRRNQYFVVIADSCFSGELVSQLRQLPPERRDVLNMAVQAACGANEVSNGGVFTSTFAGKQRTPPEKFEWQRMFDDPERVRPKCTECRAFFTEGCRMCRRLQRAGFWASKDDIQHPTFYCTWCKPSNHSVDATRVPFQSAPLRFFKR